MLVLKLFGQGSRQHFGDEVFKDKVVWAWDAADVSKTFPIQMLFLSLNCLAKQPLTWIQEPVRNLQLTFTDG